MKMNFLQMPVFKMQKSLFTLAQKLGVFRNDFAVQVKLKMNFLQMPFFKMQKSTVS